jgi:spermidine synthase
MINKGLIYFQDGKLVAEHGDARVYKMNGELFLEIGQGHTLCCAEGELTEYIHQISDFPKGRCLEIGLGLGIVSRYLFTFPQVTHVTTIENNLDVIKIHNDLKEEDRGLEIDYPAEKHRILHADGIEYAYQTKQKYDFIFIDCYNRIDDETLPLIADMTAACSRILNRGGKMVGWLDKHTPGPYYSIFQKIFNQY